MIRTVHRSHGLLGALIAVACAKAPTPATPAVPGLQGPWKSDGYGYYFVGRGDTLQGFEITNTTCVRSFTLTRDATAPAGETRYQTEGQVFSVMAGAAPAEQRLQGHGAASYITLRQLPATLPVCDTLTPDTPEKNFEVFANSFAEHYILFREKGVDWAAQTALARSRVTAKTTSQELFDLMKELVAPLGDAHTFLAADSIKQRFSGARPGSDRLLKDGMAAFREKKLPGILAVTNKLLSGPIRSFCNDRVQYGRVDDATGYLRILSEGGYTKDGGFDEGLVALEAALDTIFTDPALRGLIIDVRINFGGADPYGLALASRLATAEYVAYSKEARLDPDDPTKWTPGQPSVVRPSTRPGFKGPVVELIGPLTISAGETTTQALMGRTPKVIRIGENTQGVFSDVLGRRLPNGWTIGLPNEVFRDQGGRTFDGPGIPPDIAVPVFADADLAQGRDPGLARAVAELKAASASPGGGQPPPATR